MHRIRVLHCIETISSGGVEQTRLTLVRSLPKDKFQVKIICTYAGGPIAEALRKEGVELIVIGTMLHPFSWKIHSQVLAVISDFKPHVIHGAVFEGNSMAAISGWIKRVPVRILEETSDPQNRSAKANWLLRLLSAKSDAMIAISKDVESYLLNTAKVSASKVKMIFNGIPIPRTVSDVEKKLKRTELSLQDDDFVVGFVGRLFNDHKRVTDLVEAIYQINNPSLKLLIVGEGRDLDLITSRINDLSLTSQVILVGYQFRTDLYYPLMDVLCVPSAREGFGLVAVEAMLHGLPVVASKVGGLKDIILDEETGFLVSPFAPDEIASKIKTLVDVPARRKKMGAQGKQRAMDNFTAEKYGKEVEELYLELLTAKGIIHLESRI